VVGPPVRQKYIRGSGWVLGQARRLTLHFAHPFTNFCGGGGGRNKCEIWPQFSTAVASESASFHNGATCRKLKPTRAESMIGLCAALTWYSPVHSPPIKWTSKQLPRENWLGQICLVINNSATHCPFLLKFGELVHYESAETAS